MKINPSNRPTTAGEPTQTTNQNGREKRQEGKRQGLEVLILALVSFLTVAGCSTNRHVVGGTVSIPATVPTASGKVMEVDAPVADVLASNRELAFKMASMREQAAASKLEAEKATARSRALADSGQATKAQLEELWRDFQAAGQSRNMFEEKARDAENTITKQSIQIDDLVARVDEAKRAAIEKDMECSELRQALDVANKTIEQSGEALADEREKRESAENRAATAEVYRRWVLFGAAIAILFCGITMLWPIIKKSIFPI